MNPKIVVVCALVAALCNVGEAFFLVGTTAATGTTAAVTLSGGAATGLALGGLVLLKAAAVAAFAIASSSRRRGKRSTTEEQQDAAFALISQIEPDMCYRRLICDLATGQMGHDNDLIVNLVKRPVAISSPMFEFNTAARLGEQLKDITTCELRFSCPVSGKELANYL